MSKRKSILEYGIPVYCCASNTNLQKLERVQHSAARVITGLRNTCPNDIVLYTADLQPLSLRRRASLVKYYSKICSLGDRNRTSAYLRDWRNVQRLKRNSPFSMVASAHLLESNVEPNNVDPSDGLPNVHFHTDLSVQVNKQDDLPVYLKQLALEIINDIPADAIKMYTDGSKNEKG
ncbi:reverse transcriptase domain-containing protein [Caerostris darwini]|uniref:Reverse transcriptase domain-containing protein n=1 Tax=Caerostris darwini TaxID=1538125 RepID=A0AAV4V5N3_9ARAC|nr:reverse transcriptase domain-containing protein [Caerostris darwini]